MEDWLTVEEFCREVAGFTKQRFSQLEAAGRVPPMVMKGRTRLIHRDQARAWMETRRLQAEMDRARRARKAAVETAGRVA